MAEYASWPAAACRLQFAEREGDSRVPEAYSHDDGFRLGSWVTLQRQARRKGQLADERERRLEALPGWVWHTREAAWEHGYTRLRKFVKREGHSRVSVKYSDPDGYRLGMWVSNQRARQDNLSHEHVGRLEALPGWVWDIAESQWEDAYERLRNFAGREGHSRVPWSHREDDGFPLFSWVTTQRHSHKRGQLSKERAQRLEALPGWVWRGK